MPGQVKYGSSGCKDKVWGMASKIKGMNPATYRKDPYGNQICKSSYGTNGTQGWQIDHIKPQSRGGSGSVRNLQALKSSVNMSKGNTLVKKSRHSS
jgi:5-methylcytosine-specific restriction endonuclease McrA